MIYLESHKKSLQIIVLESLINEIKKHLSQNYDNYSFELKFDSIVLYI